MSLRHARLYNRIAILSLISLIALCIAWELWLAPLRPGGSWLVLKTLPLLAPLFGLLHGRRYTHQWCCLLVLAYFIEGVVRSLSDAGPSSRLAIIEIILALGCFLGCAFYARATGQQRSPTD